MPVVLVERAFLWNPVPYDAPTTLWLFRGNVHYDMIPELLDIPFIVAHVQPATSPGINVRLLLQNGLQWVEAPIPTADPPPPEVNPGWPEEQVSDTEITP